MGTRSKRATRRSLLVPDYDRVAARIREPRILSRVSAIERYAAGDFPNQERRRRLPACVNPRRIVDEANVVVADYRDDACARPEKTTRYATESIGFKLVPHASRRNPQLDAPDRRCTGRAVVASANDYDDS